LVRSPVEHNHVVVLADLHVLVLCGIREVLLSVILLPNHELLVAH